MKNNFLNSEETRNKYIDSISSTEIIKSSEIKQIHVTHNFISGAFVEINGNYDGDLTVSFYNEDNSELIHRSNIKCNMWTKTNRQYYTNWRLEVKDISGKILFNKSINLSDKRVYISIESSSIGDNLAWMPFLEEFRKKHNCNLIVSTFWNHLFEGVYTDIEFVAPGSVVGNIYAMYKVGCFYDSNMEPELCNTIPLQKVASNILGLEHTEIKPLIDRDKSKDWPLTLTQKFVAIAPHSTAGLKYWNNPTGWQEVVDFLISKGYYVFNVSREGSNLNGVKNLNDYSIEEIIRCIRGCDFFIGLSSGLSWLAWALEKHVFLISNFTNKEHEFLSNCTRITNESVCNSCWVKPEFKFDKGDWNWCPIHKGTDRQFECSKSITGQFVIGKIKEYLVDGFDWGDSNSSLINELNKEIFEDKIYERVYEVKEGDVVVDIGASIGPFTYSILDKNPKVVYCLEPSVSQYKTLIKNFTNKPVVCINKGISKENGPIRNQYIFGPEGQQEIMFGVTFKTFIEEYGVKNIDFLKLDCEGGEYDILNLENLELVKNTIEKISAEFHLRTPELKEKFKSFIENILPHLKSYKVFSIDGVDITSNITSDNFIKYYNEVMLYIKVI
jgi:autotransporter strand-loop-strand O-heptosyltransferase